SRFYGLFNRSHWCITCIDIGCCWFARKLDFALLLVVSVPSDRNWISGLNGPSSFSRTFRGRFFSFSCRRASRVSGVSLLSDFRDLINQLLLSELVHITNT